LREQVQRHRDDVDVAGASRRLPNSVPSTRSAPAISANSAAATAVPRSLCGCTDNSTLSRSEMWRAEPFELVGVGVRRRHLDGGGQVEDQRLSRASDGSRP